MWRIPTLTRVAAASILASIGPAPSMAAQMTMGDLYDICTASDDASVMACRFYILGVVEGTSTGARPAGAKGWPCIPDGILSTAMVALVKLRMGEDLAFFPQDKMIPAVSFIIAAFAKQYPCR